MSRTCRLSWLVLALAVAFISPASADSYLVYGESGIPPASDLFVWCESEPLCDVATPINCDNPEGGAALRFRANAYIGWGVFLNQPQDLSAYAGGDLKYWVKSPLDVKVEIQCDEAAGRQTYTRFASQDGLVTDNTWQEITVPVCDFFPGGTCIADCLDDVKAPFMSTVEMPSFNTFRVDRVRWEKSNAASHTGPTPVAVQGRQLLVNGEPFVVNAVGYSPLSVGENWTGAWRDRPDRYLVDFPLMAAAGINTVRLYAPVLSTGLLDAAWASGLYVIPNFGVNPAQLTCPQGRQYVIDQFVEEVNEWKDHPAILAWLVGNEVNILPGYPGDSVWYPQLEAMAAAAKAAEGATAHPVGTANADDSLNGICEVGISDDTALPSVDFWAVQLYRGCSFGTAFTQYANKADCDRPLIITEFGADAYDSGLDAEDQTMQADCLGSLLAEAEQQLAVRNPAGVLAGQAVFEWADEWWKANPNADNPDNTCVDGLTAWDQHDPCVSGNNFGYTNDPGMNEEWWGIATNNSGDPAARGLRTAAARLSDSYRLGSVCDMDVVASDITGENLSISFDPADGSADHTLYYGPLGSVSSYGYTGSVANLGATGASAVTLPSGSLFWVIAPNNGVEGCYGTDSAGTERPCSGAGCAAAQSPSRDCECSTP